jgi:signal transduction histidine kinase
MLEYRTPPGQAPARTEMRLETSRLWRSLQQHEPVVIHDILDESAQARDYREGMGDALEMVRTYVRSYLALPMIVKDRVIGALLLTHQEPGYFTSPRVALALAIASQAALAIENARLHERAQEVAALEERQRLARELHDSVSQALFGIRVGTQTVRERLQRDPAKAVESLEYVQSLAQAGMAEMRALLFELRPESLQTEGLVAGLRKQADALRARYEIPVETELCEEPAVSLAVKEAVFRIAQEALHNTYKHADPSTVRLCLLCQPEGLLLEVRDNGRGFDTTASFPGHLGLQSMKERAIRVGGTLSIESAPERGTLVRVWIPTSAG